jgi:nitrogen fixation/metabolism regulation signal transduction histidine kinase
VAIVNIYVLLFAFAVFITFVLSSRITKPLQMIREKLSEISFGKRNDLIEWNHNDEIGALVKVYNRMAHELSASAEKLARSERESAWREMARQVAHEIKNPLTPMKLGIQHLERARREKHLDLDQIIQRMSKVMIEQIDALSNIATEFSGFAQMPPANNTIVDAASVMKGVINLYDGTDAATIEFHPIGDGPFLVYVDREQLMRVYSNIIKNAVQSLVPERPGNVKVTMQLFEGKVITEIRDNGSGISEEQRSRIFVPNFTTKSGGTGLGLAISHQIITQAGGSIRFESEVGTGTVFIVEIPATAVV